MHSQATAAKYHICTFSVRLFSETLFAYAKRKVKDQFYETQHPHPTKYNPILVHDSKNFRLNILSADTDPG